MLPDTLRARLDTRPCVLGAWLFLREPLAAEAASRQGYDKVCIDGQHGIHDYSSIVTMLTAIVAGGAAPAIARVPGNETGFAAVHAEAGLVAKRRAQGFQMITIGFDLQPMMAGLSGALAEGRRQSE